MASGREIRAGIDNLGLNGSLVLASANALAIINFYIDAYREFPTITDWLLVALAFNFVAICLNLYQFRASRKTSRKNEQWLEAKEKFEAREGDSISQEGRDLASVEVSRLYNAYKTEEFWSKMCWWSGFCSIAAGYAVILLGLWGHR